MCPRSTVEDLEDDYSYPGPEEGFPLVEVDTWGRWFRRRNALVQNDYGIQYRFVKISKIMKPA